MEKIKSARPVKAARPKSKPKAKPLPPLATGQVWRIGELNLQVGRVGPMLVQYKLAKPDAVRVPNIMNSKTTIEAYLKKSKAVLIQAAPVV
jgi:hypothetical protein